jgi:hypothetical protein
MPEPPSYEQREIQQVAAAIRNGHRDPDNLRELLIGTTSKTTCSTVEAYFAEHYEDRALLSALVQIALEGEDSGDAPWAAANIITGFPAQLLASHKKSLVLLSQHQWSYLHGPAREALAKIAACTA